MAEVDKALPNVKQTVKIPSPREQMEIATELQESIPQPGDVEVNQMEDGGAEVTFEPGAVNQAGGQDHYANLADLLPDSVLSALGSEMWAN